MGRAVGVGAPSGDSTEHSSDEEQYAEESSRAEATQENNLLRLMRIANDKAFDQSCFANGERPTKEQYYEEQLHLYKQIDGVKGRKVGGKSEPRENIMRQCTGRI